MPKDATKEVHVQLKNHFYKCAIKCAMQAVLYNVERARQTCRKMMPFVVWNLCKINKRAPIPARSIAVHCTLLHKKHHELKNGRAWTISRFVSVW